jgi:hypothetical protein
MSTPLYLIGTRERVGLPKIHEADSVTLYVNGKEVYVKRVGGDSLDIRVEKSFKGEEPDYGIFVVPSDIITLLLRRGLEKNVTWRPKYVPPMNEVIFTLKRKNVEKQREPPKKYKVKIEDSKFFIDFLKEDDSTAAKLIYEIIKRSEDGKDIEKIYFEVNRTLKSEISEPKIFF